MVKGYPIKIVLPENVSVERKQLLELWGAEIIATPGTEGSNGAMRHARELAEQHPEYWYPFQYGNAANPRAHYEGTGPEIWRDAPEVTHFVAGLGTSGTLIGVGTYLKEQNPELQIWAIEPPLGEMVDGLKNFDEGFVPPVFIDGNGYELLNRKKAIGIRESLEFDAAPSRRRRVRRDLQRRGGGGRRQVRRGDRRRNHRDRDRRRRLEVPVDRGLDRRSRRGRGAGEGNHLLLTLWSVFSVV